tara:strand:+ start:397 stop:582 length:186 start_codon:yes stop_codon:yes gene_type:complete
MEPTVASVDAEIMAHERECAERYKRIEERLAEGQQRFTRLENMVWGIYGILIATNILNHIV